MQHRTIRKRAGGKWEPIRWQEARPGDIIRVYERGMLSGEMDAEVLSLCGVIEIDGNIYKDLATDQGRINSKGIFKPQASIRNPHKKKHRARPKKVLK
jgi:hypothetical protein